MSDLAAKLLIIFGALIIVLGLVLLFFDRIPFLGKLPGDLSFRSGNTRIYLPIAGCIILSGLLTIILNLISRWK
jgi:Zn-dependent protease with chaperone function